VATGDRWFSAHPGNHLDRSAPSVLSHYPQRDRTWAIANSAQILGVHLEGPFLNPAKRGAHPPGIFVAIDPGSTANLLADYGDLVKLITLAPELDSKSEAIPWLVDRGIVVSLGHSTRNGGANPGSI
jgi:N-acetylglucosamine-6-phosphate deacetylase